MRDKHRNTLEADVEMKTGSDGAAGKGRENADKGQGKEGQLCVDMDA